MKLAIVIAAMLAGTAAQAQSITHIARYADYTVALSDMPCPASEWSKTAIFNSYGTEKGTAYGCWSGTRDVDIRWFKVNTERKLPEKVPGKDFEKTSG